MCGVRSIGSCTRAASTSATALRRCGGKRCGKKTHCVHTGYQIELASAMAAAVSKHTTRSSTSNIITAVSLVVVVANCVVSGEVGEQGAVNQKNLHCSSRGGGGQTNPTTEATRIHTGPDLERDGENTRMRRVVGSSKRALRGLCVRSTAAPRPAFPRHAEIKGSVLSRNWSWNHREPGRGRQMYPTPPECRKKAGGDSRLLLQKRADRA